MADKNNNQVETKEIENKSNGKVVEVKAKKTKQKKNKDKKPNKFAKSFTNSKDLGSYMPVSYLDKAPEDIFNCSHTYSCVHWCSDLNCLILSPKIIIIPTFLSLLYFHFMKKANLFSVNEKNIKNFWKKYWQISVNEIKYNLL